MKRQVENELRSNEKRALVNRGASTRPPSPERDIFGELHSSIVRDEKGKLDRFCCSDSDEDLPYSRGLARYVYSC